MLPVFCQFSLEVTLEFSELLLLYSSYINCGYCSLSVSNFFLFPLL